MKSKIIANDLIIDVTNTDGLIAAKALKTCKQNNALDKNTKNHFGTNNFRTINNIQNYPEKANDIYIYSNNTEENLSSIETIEIKESKKRGKKIVWSAKEEEVLFNLGRQDIKRKWRSISKMFRNKTPSQCYYHFNSRNPEIKRKNWTNEEDQKIKHLYNLYGRKWEEIARCLKNRTGKQVRDRILNTLDDSIKHSKFSECEDLMIYKLYCRYGPSWSRISKIMKTRSSDMVKSRFYSSIKKRFFDNKHENENLFPIISNNSNYLSTSHSSTILLSQQSHDSEDNCEFNDNYFNFPEDKHQNAEENKFILIMNDRWNHNDINEYKNFKMEIKSNISISAGNIIMETPYWQEIQVKKPKKQISNKSFENIIGVDFEINGDFNVYEKIPNVNLTNNINKDINLFVVIFFLFIQISYQVIWEKISHLDIIYTFFYLHSLEI